MQSSEWRELVKHKSCVVGPLALLVQPVLSLELLKTWHPYCQSVSQVLAGLCMYLLKFVFLLLNGYSKPIMLKKCTGVHQPWGMYLEWDQDGHWVTIEKPFVPTTHRNFIPIGVILKMLVLDFFYVFLFFYYFIFIMLYKSIDQQKIGK